MPYPPFHPASVEPPKLTLTSSAFRSEFPAENEYVEFKQGLSRSEIQKAVVAFSNADGGVLFAGVRQDGVEVGRALSGETAAEIHQAISYLTNPGRYQLRELQVGDIPVIVVSVQKRSEGVAQMPNGAVLVRRGASNQPLLGEELWNLLSQRTLRPFERTHTEATLEDADLDLIRRVADAWGWSGEAIPERIRESGLAVVEEGADRLTVVGALYLLGRPEQVLGKAFIEIFRYREGRQEYDKRIKISGPLDKQVQQATEAIRAELGSDMVFLGVKRFELERIPVSVLREAVANAVAHRTYEASNSSIRVDIRPDSVVITSPGPLPEPITEENIRDQNASRNQEVIRQLRRMGLAEDAGRGVDHMQDTMEDNLLDPPLFEDTGHHVRVTLRMQSTVTAEERAWVRELESRGELKPADRILLIHAARGERLTNSLARSLLALDSVEARGSLQRLRGSGLLIQEGSGRGTHYLLARDLRAPSGLRLSKRELDEVVIELARQGPVTNTLVRQRTGLDRKQAVRLLGSLVASGELKRVGERRGTHYVLFDQ